RQTSPRRTAPPEPPPALRDSPGPAVLTLDPHEGDATRRRRHAPPRVRRQFLASALRRRDDGARVRAAGRRDSQRAAPRSARDGGGGPACMALPAPTARSTPGGLQLMPHQGQVVAAAAAGHRTFLLADEPGLGKTAEALLAAEAANAYPLLVVVPSVVKTNWA